jgi:hypothetical protein
MRGVAGAFYEGPAQEFGDGLAGWLRHLGDKIAETSAVFCWGPNQGWDLTPRQIKWWYSQGVRVEKLRRY